MTHELYKKYRPGNLADLYGQPAAVQVLTKMIDKGIPHALLLSGPSGCGKTTIARILKRHLKCGDLDWSELNCADFRGVDMVRDIRNQISRKPLSGPCRIWTIDEAHQLTKDAQNALLKMLEDTPEHVYFMLCTADSGKLIKAIQTRCTEIRLKSISEKDLCQIIAGVVEKEIPKSADYPPDEVIEKIAEFAEGSARKALVLLEQVIGLDSPDDQIDALEKSDFKVASIEIGRALLNPRTKWPDMVKVINGVDEADETLRRMVLGYATEVLLGGGKLAGRAFLIVQAFRDHWFDCGKAGLVAACYEVLHA